MAQKELSGKISLVTGSARGIGRAIALKLAEMGSQVALNDLPDNSSADETLQDILSSGGEAMLAPADITNSQAVKLAFDMVLEKWGKIDILVNNAGISGKNNVLLRTTEMDWDTVLDTNLRSAFLCTKLALRSMLVQNWGRIINMASVAGLLGNMGRVDYASSKGGLIAFTRSLAAEVGSRNITVNAIAPGIIDTQMSAAVPQEAKDFILSRTALKRSGKPQDAAELAAFLATDRAGYISGQVIAVDGGIT